MLSRPTEPEEKLLGRFGLFFRSVLKDSLFLDTAHLEAADCSLSGVLIHIRNYNLQPMASERRLLPSTRLKRRVSCGGATFIRCFQPRYLLALHLRSGAHIFCSVWGLTLRGGTSPRSIFKFINRHRCHLAVFLCSKDWGVAITEGRPPVGRLHPRRQAVIGVIYHLRKGLRAHYTNHTSARCWERRNARTHTRLHSDINHRQTHKLRERWWSSLKYGKYWISHKTILWRYDDTIQPFCGNIHALWENDRQYIRIFVLKAD